MLESAEQTLNYWREQYDRFQQKKQLMMKRRFLERELAWAEVSMKETSISELEKEIDYKKRSLEKIEKTIKLSEEEISKIQGMTKNLRDEQERILEESFLLEKEKVLHEINIFKGEENTKELIRWVELGQNDVLKILDNAVFLESATGLNSNDLESRIKEIRNVSEDLKKWFQNLGCRLKDLEDSINVSTEIISGLDAKLVDVKNKLQKVNREIDESYNLIVDKKVNLAMLENQREKLSKEVSVMDSNLKVLRSDLNAAFKRAEEMGPRVASLRSMDVVLDEIRIIDGHIAALADVSEDIEQMYESYSKLYFELKEKARIAAENREKALEEIKARTESWKNVIRDLLSHVSLEYQRILSQAGAKGSVRLINEQDIEVAGVEILVGFKGSQPAPLNIYSQSGGERSTATMSFLLALQQRIRSPFRAVDEYDVHMDPKNREVIANLLILAVSRGEAQYLAITPNQMLFEGKDVHIITVQNIEGISLVKEVS
jgi:chromosome segregation ATPase